MTNPSSDVLERLPDAMFQAAWNAHRELFGMRAGPMPKSRTDSARYYRAIYVAMREHDPTIERLTAELERVKGAATDALAGWRYIRQHHGDLYGVGWDRVESNLVAALSVETSK